VYLLQADKTEYPSWVTGRYLQVPSSVSARVAELAQEIAAPYDNPYDKATAIESYLRNYPYSTDIAAPPEGTDAVGYFLFEVKQGYCDYYASAMAVMLRTIGIPSRLVAGYAPGEPLAGDAKPVYTDKYRVLEKDAHAWVEVLFPSYGWIQFEPTASQPLVQRVVASEPIAAGRTPEPPVPNDEKIPGSLNAGTSESPTQSAHTPSELIKWVQKHGIVLGLVSGAILLLVIIALYRRRQERAFLASPELLAGLLAKVGTWASRLRISWPASHTPLEHAASFGQEAPEVRSVVDQIAALFVAQRYGRQAPPPETLQVVAREWGSVQSSLWRRWLQRLARPQASSSSATPTPGGRVPPPPDPDQGPRPETSRRR
jgi:transglutaminase-like putative cysteine protease